MYIMLHNMFVRVYVCRENVSTCMQYTVNNPRSCKARDLKYKRLTCIELGLALSL